MHAADAIGTISAIYVSCYWYYPCYMYYGIGTISDMHITMHSCGYWRKRDMRYGMRSKSEQSRVLAEFLTISGSGSLTKSRQARISAGLALFGPSTSEAHRHDLNCKPCLAGAVINTDEKKTQMTSLLVR